MTTMRLASVVGVINQDHKNFLNFRNKLRAWIVIESESKWQIWHMIDEYWLKLFPGQALQETMMLNQDHKKWA